jgi:formate hydrogenlyase transcriptional activator
MQATVDKRDIPATIRPVPQARGVSRGRQVPDGIVGHAQRFEEVLERINRVSATSATVLITGETGTGKELVARAIHRRSRRSSHAMVSANLAALPHDLVASELFGHEAGAFTGAIQRRIGRFEAAEASTLFLDEVGELPPGVQVALLRALQEGEFERIGSSQTRTADVRIIAATNRNLEEAIEEGLFRRDLFYRLAVFPIHVPPLRERREDIPGLADHFLGKVADRLGREFSGIDAVSMDRLIEYSWPGNIRELQNVIEHSAILSDGGVLQVPPVLLSTRVIAGPTTASSLSDAIDAGEKRLIEQALEESNGRVFGPTGAATRLGIPSSTLESKIKRHRINKHQYRSSVRWPDRRERTAASR